MYHTALLFESMWCITVQANFVVVLIHPCTPAQRLFVVFPPPPLSFSILLVFFVCVYVFLFFSCLFTPAVPPPPSLGFVVDGIAATTAYY